MLVRPTSDWHTELMGDNHHEVIQIIDKEILPPLDTDKNSILILAGDIGSLKKPKSLVWAIDHVAPRFKFVLYIPGNHEYWGGDLRDGVVNINNYIKHQPNVIFDNFEKIPFEYLGEKARNDVWMCTLWTDYRNGNPLVMLACQRGIKDYKCIKGLKGKMGLDATPQEILEIHNCMREQLVEGVKPGDIVITHHLPTYQSMAPEYRTDKFNPAYASDMDHLIEMLEPVLWIHGHIHSSADHTIGTTRMICNSVGYSHHRNKEYNPNLVIEI